MFRIFFLDKMIVFLSVLFMSVNAVSKSLYVIADISFYESTAPVHSYDIQGDSLVYQTKYEVPNYNYGAVGLAIDTDSKFLFITYEESNVIQLVNAETMLGEGSVIAPGASNLAGIDVDQGKQKVYTVDREKNHLYVYSWDALNKKLTLEGGSYVVLKNVSRAYGIALDEIDGYLYVADIASTKVRYYDTEDWVEAGNFTISQYPTGIAVDVIKKFVYTGCAQENWNQSLISKYDLTTGVESTHYMGSGNSAVGLAVDSESGFLYVTTGLNSTPDGTDEVLVFNSDLNQLYTTGDLGGDPTGICVPGKDIAYNPLNLSKEDSFTAGEGVCPGEQVTYKICFDNTLNPNLSVSNVLIQDILPSGVSFVSAKSGNYEYINKIVTWDIGTLSASEKQKCVDLIVFVDDTVAAGSTIHNECTINSDNTPPTTKGVYTKVVAPADFRLNITLDTVFVNAGGSTSLKISIDSMNGFSDIIDLSASGLPALIDSYFEPDSIDAVSESELKIQTDSRTPPGNYELIVTGSSEALTRSDTIVLVVNESAPVYIYPSADSLLFAGDEFWLDIFVGDSVNPVRKLYGTSFVLVYDTSFVKVVSPFDSIVPGDFLGLKHNVKYFAHFFDSLSIDSLGLAVTRIESDSAVNGWGCILSVKFMIKSSIPDTEICFYITDVTANDNNWNPVILTPRDSCFAVRGNLNVWPGDTDNNGIVDQADMLPIGLSWGEEGSARICSNLSEWKAQMCRPWMQGDRYTYADAYGDGVVDELDVSVICINWHCIQGEICTADVCKSLAVAGKGGTIQAVVLDKISDDFIDVELLIEDVENILGMGIKFQYPTDKAEVVTVLQGDYWGETPIFLYKNDSYNGIVGIGTGRIRLQGCVSGSGCVARIRLRSESETALYQLGFGRVVGMDVLGNILDFEVINEIQKEIKKSTTFKLYQNYPNPFNISTVIRYELPEISRVTVKVYDLLGTEVKTLEDNIKEAGSYSAVWDGKNKNYERVSSGIYYFSIKADEFSAVRKGLLLK